MKRLFLPLRKCLPWRFFVQRLALAHGFMDPLSVLARLQRFAEPSEVGEPIELLRAGLVFHARGLINSRVIQHNLDWVWPFWIERQFDPASEAFLPRAFSITHCNLSHRNWTAVGWPDVDELPIVDPRGLLTPHHDSWSLDAWVISDEGIQLLPSRTPASEQHLTFEKGVTVVTESHACGAALQVKAYVEVATASDNAAMCHMDIEASSPGKGWLVVSLRPCNPEGISAVYNVAWSEEDCGWRINDTHSVLFDQVPVRHAMSTYKRGDVNFQLADGEEQRQVHCDVGMATAAAMFPARENQRLRVGVSIPLIENNHLDPQAPANNGAYEDWHQALEDCCQLTVPDKKFQFLYDAVLRTLVLHSPADVYPGPFTYKRFWFRDAAFIIQALLFAGLTRRAERALDRFSLRQKHSGYFHSQDGEWDSNGEALWILHRFVEYTNCPVKDSWRKPIVRGARWITRKRLDTASNEPFAGLLPAGFSAEHLGPNDYYYWDDFWGIAGLRSAADLCQRDHDPAQARAFLAQADDFEHAVLRSLDRAASRLDCAAMPASPNRRLDAGAIGSLAAGYPLQLFPGRDDRLLETVEFLIDRCFVDGGFFQDIIHSGINPYLTLHVAQVLLRAGDRRCFELMTNVAELASPTGQWPEAIYPRTGGGCMGDGQHVWAAAEWIAVLRNCFLYEEGDRLILAAGIPEHWLTAATETT
ncbi:MAG TPA: hypothetical protein DCZ13_14080, partial [Porticoccaceae bacterium]|nr:hypothetical protein [Porticoccaceae bacterium]